MASTETLTASLEDYLEAIFHIIREKQAVRPKDIAKRLDVSNASVTGALRSLADKALIHYNPYDVITLTDSGKTAAMDVVRRHEVLRDFFVKILSVSHAEADSAACQMEHAIPHNILERLVRFAEFIEVCPRAGADWIAKFSRQCHQSDGGGASKNCHQCVSNALEETRARHDETRGDKDAPPQLRLKDLKPGQRAHITKINSRSAASKRIVEMGITPRAVVEMERVAPMGDPIDIKVKGYHLSLRKDEAECIFVQRL